MKILIPKLGWYFTTKQSEVEVTPEVLATLTKPYDAKGGGCGFFASGKYLIIPPGSVFKLTTEESKSAGNRRYYGTGQGGAQIYFPTTFNKRVKVGGSWHILDNPRCEIEADWIAETTIRQSEVSSIIRPLFT